ncbi:MAG: c-type cytochrome [Betaproteobacteria bacterium]|nr:c-type cytochrome [Betaproteobacteria bacterium]
MKKITLSLALALTALASGCANLEHSRDVANPAVTGKVMAEQTCSMCHGVDGNSINPTFPKLAGQQKEYMTDELKFFRSHNRSDPAGSEYMWGISRHLTDQQIAQLADYYAAQKRIPQPSTNVPLEELGKNIFLNGIQDGARTVPACQTCHGADAHGHGVFPYIAGQHADYIRKQLDIFKETEERDEKVGEMMKNETHDLSSEEMKAVAAYIATMP